MLNVRSYLFAVVLSLLMLGCSDEAPESSRKFLNKVDVRGAVKGQLNGLGEDACAAHVLRTDDGVDHNVIEFSRNGCDEQGMPNEVAFYLNYRRASNDPNADYILINNNVPVGRAIVVIEVSHMKTVIAGEPGKVIDIQLQSLCPELPIADGEAGLLCHLSVEDGHFATFHLDNDAIATLEQHRAYLSTEIGSLRSSAQTASQTIAALRTEVGGLKTDSEKTKAELTAQLDSLQESFDMLTHEYSENYAEYVNSLMDISDLEAKIAELQETLTSERLASLWQRTRATYFAFVSHAKIIGLKKKIEKMTESHQMQVTELNEIIDGLRQDLMSANGDIAKLERKLSNARKTIRKLREKLRAARSTITSQQGTIASQQVTMALNTLESYVDSVRAYIQTQNLKAQLSAAKEAHADSRDQVIATQQKVIEVQEELAKVLKKAMKAEGRIGSLETEKERSKALIEDLNGEIDRLKAKINQIEFQALSEKIGETYEKMKAAIAKIFEPKPPVMDPADE